MQKKPKFEDCIDTIDNELVKRRGKWRLGALSYIDYDDVCQIIRLHIWKKWHLYDPEMPLANWVQRIITNQIKNITRNHSVGIGKPCDVCVHKTGDELCELYEIQCDLCPLYKKWCSRDKVKHDVRLPVSIENHTNVPDCESLDWEKALENIHSKIMPVLKPHQQVIYKLCFIDHKTDEVIAIELGYSGAKLKRGLGYVKSVRKTVVDTAIKIIKNSEFNIYGL